MVGSDDFISLFKKNGPFLRGMLRNLPETNSVQAPENRGPLGSQDIPIPMMDPWDWYIYLHETP